MGFTYRKSVNLGPFRVNLSKSGLGYSVGGRGFRVGTTARGKNIRASASPRRELAIANLALVALFCWPPSLPHSPSVGRSSLLEST